MDRMDRVQDIVYAAEKPSIATLLSTHLRHPVREQDIFVHHDPAETGSFLISWRFARFRMTPAGQVEALGLARRPAPFAAA